MAKQDPGTLLMKLGCAGCMLPIAAIAVIWIIAVIVGTIQSMFGG